MSDEETVVHKKRVLLVEDNDATSRSIAKLLEIKGYEVVIAATLEEAKKQVAGDLFFTHLVCDYDLKGENGLEAASDFFDKFPKSGILIFTGYTDFLRMPPVVEFYGQNAFARNLKVEYKPIEQNQLFSWFNEINKKLEADGYIEAE